MANGGFEGEFFVKSSRNYASCSYFHNFYRCLESFCISYFYQQENTGRIYWSISGVVTTVKAFQYMLTFQMVRTSIFQALLSCCIYHLSSAMNRLNLFLRAYHPVHHRVAFLQKRWASRAKMPKTNKKLWHAGLELMC